jgi:hypothetical protein
MDLQNEVVKIAQQSLGKNYQTQLPFLENLHDIFRDNNIELDFPGPWGYQKMLNLYPIDKFEFIYKTLQKYIDKTLNGILNSGSFTEQGRSFIYLNCIFGLLTQRMFKEEQEYVLSLEKTPSLEKFNKWLITNCPYDDIEVVPYLEWTEKHQVIYDSIVKSNKNQLLSISKEILTELDAYTSSNVDEVGLLNSPVENIMSCFQILIPERSFKVPIEPFSVYTEEEFNSFYFNVWKNAANSSNGDLIIKMDKNRFNNKDEEFELHLELNTIDEKFLYELNGSSIDDSIFHDISTFAYLNLKGGFFFDDVSDDEFTCGFYLPKILVAVLLKLDADGL